MNYELAKELKDAGFPQECHGYKIFSSENLPYYPNLSELIEACGYKLRAIQREDYEDELYDIETPNEKKWCAVKEWYEFYPPAVEIGEYGSTPEEAVARLWLTLNKKD